MKVLYGLFIFLLPLNGFSQDEISRKFLNEYFGGNQFYPEINEVLNLMKQHNKQRVDFELKEYRHDNDSLGYKHTVMICEQTSDSLLKVIKYYHRQSIYYLWEYECIELFGIYLPISSHLLSRERIKGFNCFDINKGLDQKVTSDVTIVSRKDSTIVEILEKLNKLNGDEINSSKTTYCFDEKGRFIGDNNGLKITYKEGGLSTYTYEYPPNMGVGDSAKWIDDYYSIKTKKNISNDECLISINVKKQERGDNNVYELNDTLKYTYNEEGLPIKIKVLSSEYRSWLTPSRIIGSEMLIAYS